MCTTIIAMVRPPSSLGRGKRKDKRKEVGAERRHCSAVQGTPNFRVPRKNGLMLRLSEILYNDSPLRSVSVLFYYGDKSFVAPVSGK